MQIVHGSSAPLSDFIFTPIVNTKDVFGEICHHTEEGDDPHPEDRARSARDDRRRDTCDITGTDRGCQGCTQTLELADGLILFCSVGRDMSICKNGTDGLGKPMLYVRDLEKPGQKCHQNSCSDQKDQHGKSPYKSVDRTVDLCDLFNGSDSCHTASCRQ